MGRNREINESNGRGLTEGLFVSFVYFVVPSFEPKSSVNDERGYHIIREHNLERFHSHSALFSTSRWYASND